MAEELFDDELDEVSGGLLGIDEQKIFEIWKNKTKMRFVDYSHYLKAANQVVQLIKDGVSLDDLLNREYK
ncbi:MAG: hypothetical protein ACI4WM_01780 [Erysipelotrichaceae bacterium]